MIVGAAECFDHRAILPAAAAPARDSEEETSIDAATGLPGHAALEARLCAALEDFAGSRVPFGVLDIAVDNLDDVLHTNGRNAVNTVLYATGQTLSLSVGPGDMVGRWGEGRFLAVVTGCGAAALLRTAQQLKQLASLEAIPWWGDRLAAALSAGGTVVRDGDTPELLVQRAEEARQTSVQTGDGNVVVK
jgi:diguanylate cyclase (GGDEF)-like protein